MLLQGKNLKMREQSILSDLEIYIRVAYKNARENDFDFNGLTDRQIAEDMMNLDEDVYESTINILTQFVKKAKEYYAAHGK